MPCCEACLCLAVRVYERGGERWRARSTPRHKQVEFAMPYRYPIAPVCVRGNVARITLPCGAVALVDADMVERVSGLHWYWPDKGDRDWLGRKRNFPQVCLPHDGGLAFLNRLVMGAEPGTKVLILSGDRLDCRRTNLVLVNLHRVRLAFEKRTLVYISA